jgi:putative membrane protein
MVILGLFLGIIIWSSLKCISLVTDAFATGEFVGFATITCILFIAIGLIYLCLVECMGYFSIRRVDRLSRALAKDDVEIARALAVRWMKSIEVDTTELENADSITDVREQVEMHLASIDSRVDKTIAKESILIAAFVGISPWAMVDGAIVGWRQLRMMRSIASNYGVRPSTIGTMRLVRRVLITVVLADVSQHATQWIASKVPSMGGLIPTAGQSLALLVLTARVGKACKLACRPIDKKLDRERLSILSKCKGYWFKKRTAAKEKRNSLQFN